MHALQIRSVYGVAAVAMQQLQIEKQRVRRYKGRVPRSRNINRGKSTWIKDYLCANPIYNLRFFRRRFRIPRAMFTKPHRDLVTHFPHIFSTPKNAEQKKGISSVIKSLACLRVLRTVRAFDDLDDGTRMPGETL